jgi:L-lysine exporter family protein LysE/ArgO
LLGGHVPLVVLICAVLDIALMAAGVLGLAAVLGGHREAFVLTGAAGVLFLVWYGLAAARRAFATEQLAAQPASGSGDPAWSVALRTVAVTLLNPHVYLDTLLLVGAVGAQQPAADRGAFIAGAGAASVAWFCSLGFGARALRPLFANPRTWRVVDAVVALTMLSIAWSLARELLR